MFWNQPKKDKTPVDLLEDQLKFWRSKVGHTFLQNDAVKRITEIESHLIAMHKEQTKNLVPERIKSLENTMAELMLMGREEK